MDGMLSLRSGTLRLDLAPEIGGAIAGFSSEGPGGTIHWLRPMSAAGRQLPQPPAVIQTPTMTQGLVAPQTMDTIVGFKP